MFRGSAPAPNAVQKLRAALRGGMAGLLTLTLGVNVLTLAQPVYMIQVYDRVLVSQSIETLVFLSLMVGGALLLLGLLDAVRSIVLGRVAAAMDLAAGADALVAAMREPKAATGDVQPLRDLATVRNFVSGKGIVAYLDLPFAPLFIGLMALIHPHLFWITAGGGAVLLVLALLNQIGTARPAAAATEHGLAAMLAAQSFARSTETIAAMGMRDHVVTAWGQAEARALHANERTSRVNAGFASATRVIRMALQVAILGYGSYLVIGGEVTAGTIFAAMLISGRGLQPIEQVVSSWRALVEAAASWGRLKAVFQRNAPDPRKTELPAPSGRIVIDGITVFPSNASPGGVQEPLLKRVSAEVLPGEIMAVIGPSGAGKSTLARAMVGILQPRSGGVLIDGADLRTWDRERVGGFIGYLAQEVDLLPGTVAQNIARFDPSARDAEIVTAAKKAYAHDLIVRLPNGYDTVIGPFGRQLSGGERQRIGLARAFFGDPRMLVLDEPNSNLDTEGEIALERALMDARADGVSITLITQRRAIADKADKILALKDGAVMDWGPRPEVLARAARARPAAQAAGQASAAAFDLPRNPTSMSTRLSVVAGGAESAGDAGARERVEPAAGGIGRD